MRSQKTQEMLNQVMKTIDVAVDKYLWEPNTEMMAMSIANTIRRIVGDSFEPVHITDDAINLTDCSLLRALPYLDYVYSEIQRDKAYEVFVMGKHYCRVMYRGDTIEGNEFIHNFDITPDKPLEFVTVAFSIEGGEERGNGEIRS